MFFVKDKRAEIAAKNPTLKVTEIGSKLGEAWRALTPSDKVKYEKQAAADKLAKAGDKSIKSEKTSPKPKLSGYMKFVKANRATIVSSNPNIKFAEVGKKLGEAWRALSDDEKNKYNN
jgi:uncharacterized protein (DUF736 family)